MPPPRPTCPPIPHALQAAPRTGPCCGSTEHLGHVGGQDKTTAGQVFGAAVTLQRGSLPISHEDRELVSEAHLGGRHWRPLLEPVEDLLCGRRHLEGLSHRVSLMTVQTSASDGLRRPVRCHCGIPYCDETTLSLELCNGPARAP